MISNISVLYCFPRFLSWNINNKWRYVANKKLSNFLKNLCFPRTKVTLKNTKFASSIVIDISFISILKWLTSNIFVVILLNNLWFHYFSYRELITILRVIDFILFFKIQSLNQMFNCLFCHWLKMILRFIVSYVHNELLETEWHLGICLL